MIDVDVLDLGSVRLPERHPRAADGVCVLRGFAVRHPDGVIVVDTGAADDHPVVNELYEPSIVPLITALHGVGIDERDVVAIVNTHLHFDHCGQNRSLPTVPVWVQRADHELVETPRFTVPEWARTSDERLRLVDGDETVAEGIRIVATPGHTPGHQSVVVDTGGRPTVLAGQCCYTCAEFDRREVVPADAHGAEWVEPARDSLHRLHALEPSVVHLAHDRTVWRPR